MLTLGRVCIRPKSQRVTETLDLTSVPAMLRTALAFLAGGKRRWRRWAQVKGRLGLWMDVVRSQLVVLPSPAVAAFAERLPGVGDPYTAVSFLFAAFLRADLPHRRVKRPWREGLSLVLQSPALIDQDPQHG